MVCSAAWTARLMLERNVHHVVVTEKDVVKGVVSSLNFVRSFVSEEGRDAVASEGA